MTCGLYDRTLPLIDGTVKPDGIDLEITVNSDDRSRQRAAREGEFDVAEFFAGVYIADLEYKSLDLTAIPIFVKRMFRHSYIYVNKRSGIRSASELNGRRVGVQTWLTTTPLWARGILEEDFGVNLRSISWVARGRRLWLIGNHHLGSSLNSPLQASSSTTFCSRATSMP